jgi:hypothetical protein
MGQKEYRFANQKEGEKVLLLLRRHWTTVFGPLFFSIVIFVVPFIAWFLLFYQLHIFDLPFKAMWIGALAWFCLGGFFVVYNYLDWYLDIYLVTNIRIIDITQNGLFHRIVGETSLDHVQDIIYEVKGILPTLLNYGNITIHTAGPTGDIVFEEVSNPHRVQRYLMSEIESYKDAHADKVATPEDLLSIMLQHEKERILQTARLEAAAENAPLSPPPAPPQIDTAEPKALPDNTKNPTSSDAEPLP